MEWPERDTGSLEPIPGRCGSKLKGRERYCQKWPLTGRERCEMHNGGAARGALASGFKHGGYSKYMPERIRERFEVAQTDPELLSVRSSTALIAARIDELTEQVYSGEAMAVWKELFKTWDEFLKHRLRGNVDAMQLALEDHGKVLQSGRGVTAAWEELGIQVDRHARLAEQEQRRLDKLSATMTVEDAMGLLGTVLDVINRHTTPEQQQQIGTELDQLVTLDAVPLAARSRRRRR